MRFSCADMPFELLPTDVIDDVFRRLKVDELEKLIGVFQDQQGSEILARLQAAKYACVIVCNLLVDQLLLLPEPRLHAVIPYSSILSTFEFEERACEIARVYNTTDTTKCVYYILDSTGERIPMHRSMRHWSKLVKQGLCELANVMSHLYFFLEPIAHLTLMEEFLNLQAMNTTFFNFVFRHYHELRQSKTLYINSGIFFNDSQRINFEHLVQFNLTDITLTNMRIGPADEITFPRSVLRLNLSNNRLEDTDNLKLPQQLQVLDISHNALKLVNRLPPALQELRLQFNRLPNSVFDSVPQSVTVLDLSYNQVSSIKEQTLRHLLRLKLTGCPILEHPTNHTVEIIS